jgi:hypothetical protein
VLATLGAGVAAPLPGFGPEARLAAMSDTLYVTAAEMSAHA